jgi:hypothetical protein
MDLSRVNDPETVHAAAQLLERENRKLLEKVLALQAKVAALQPVLGADETRWRMLSAKGKDLGEARQWQVWGLSAPKAVCYAILDSRGAEAGRTVLGGYRGVVMADGYGVDGALSKEDGGFTLVNCWAHDQALPPAGHAVRAVARLAGGAGSHEGDAAGGGREARSDPAARTDSRRPVAADAELVLRPGEGVARSRLREALSSGFSGG